MPRCPECGETVEKGQAHCFACGSDFVLTPAKTRFIKSNAVFIVSILGGCIIAIVVALMIARPKPEPPSQDFESTPLTKTKTPTSIPVKSKEITKLSDAGQLSQVLGELETKLAKVESRATTEEFNRDEKDALRFTQKLISEMKLLLQSLKNAKTKEEEKRIIRQFRSKQNEVLGFLVILKNRF